MGFTTTAFFKFRLPILSRRSYVVHLHCFLNLSVLRPNFPVHSSAFITFSGTQLLSRDSPFDIQLDDPFYITSQSWVLLDVFL
jgi:hypothetical protein